MAFLANKNVISSPAQEQNITRKIDKGSKCVYDALCLSDFVNMYMKADEEAGSYPIFKYEIIAMVVYNLPKEATK